MAPRCAAAVCALMVFVVACSNTDEPESRSTAASTPARSEESAATNAPTTSTETQVSATVTSPATTTVSTVGRSDVAPTTLVDEYVPVPDHVPPPEPISDDANGAVELAAAQGCDPDSPASPAVVLSWTPAPDQQQLVAVATLADGFETNRFTVSDELSADTSTYRISPIEPGGIYYWRVLTWNDGAWSASDISTFTGPTCILDSASSP